MWTHQSKHVSNHYFKSKLKVNNIIKGLLILAKAELLWLNNEKNNLIYISPKNTKVYPKILDHRYCYYYTHTYVCVFIYTHTCI